MSELDNLNQKIDSLLTKVTRLEYAILIMLTLMFLFFGLSLHYK
jgi:hypothetical protein